MIPGLHELSAAFQGLGHAVTGNIDGANQCWDNYKHESVIGSISAAVVSENKQDGDAQQYWNGAASAGAHALAGGGILGDVPAFQELVSKGKKLSDFYAGCSGRVNDRWEKDHVDNSCLGSRAAAVVTAADGNHDKTRELGINCGNSLGKTAATSATIGTAFGARTAASASALDAAIDGKEASPSKCIGSGMMGAVGGSRFTKTKSSQCIYRSISKENANNAVKNQKFDTAANQHGSHGEACFPESTTHQQSHYKNMKSSGRSDPDFKVVEAKVDPKQYKERLQKHPKGNGDMLVKMRDLDSFNGIITHASIKLTDPAQLKYRNTLAKNILRVYKGTVVVISTLAFPDHVRLDDSAEYYATKIPFNELPGVSARCSYDELVSGKVSFVCESSDIGTEEFAIDCTLDVCNKSKSACVVRDANGHRMTDDGSVASSSSSRRRKSFNHKMLVQPGRPGTNCYDKDSTTYYSTTEGSSCDS